MNFSSYKYHYFSFVNRFGMQKCYQKEPVEVKKIYFEVSSNSLPSADDISVLFSLKALESLSGQKPSLRAVGSRYVGTTKKSFFSASVNLKIAHFFSFLEVMSVCFFPAAQKRVGVVKDKNLFRHTKITLCLNDLQLFSQYVETPIPYNVLATIVPSVGGSSFFDMLQLFKFNYIR